MRIASHHVLLQCSEQILNFEFAHIYVFLQITYAEWKGGYGKTVCIDHGNGLATLYAHNSELQVHPGQVVRKGHVIALSGNTGFSTGPHLHFEIHKDGLTIDPLDVIPPIS